MELGVERSIRLDSSDGLGAAKTPIAVVQAKRRAESETMIVIFR